VFRHGPTYAGHATCCAAALANIALLGDGLLERGRELEGPLFESLTALAGHPAVADVRGGVGLLAAVELSDQILESQPGALGKVVAGARAEGVLVRPLARAVAVSPPLTATTEHFGLIAGAIERGLAEL
jgi:adenosylmethionine-8-amino-7-oxononanoate aminotransferase